MSLIQSEFKPHTYSDIQKKINVNSFELLRQIARDSVIEPFEGRKSLETLQKASAGLEKGVEKIKNFSGKANTWFSETQVVKDSKIKFHKQVKKIQGQTSSSRFSGLFQKTSDLTKDLGERAKTTYSDSQEKVKVIAFEQVKKGLELLLIEDTEAWILKRVEDVLNRKIKTIDQVENLSIEERKKLVQALYPYDSPAFSQYHKTFETTVNVGLGAIVATNLPGTGIAVSMINMGKTLIKMGNRINIMSAIYGQSISSSQALFQVCTVILKSLQDWEGNPEHIPLDPDILKPLYTKHPEETEDAFQTLLTNIVKKEAYIAIPGVGMMSLGKIGLDDLKMDLLIQHLVENYFAKQELSNLIDIETLNNLLERYQRVYKVFIDQNFFKLSRANQELEKAEPEESGWKKRIRWITDFDSALEKSSKDLDRFAAEIVAITYDFPQKQADLIAKKEIESIINQQDQTT